MVQGSLFGDPGIIHAVSGALSGMLVFILMLSWCSAQVVSVLFTCMAAGMDLAGMDISQLSK